MSAPLPPSAVFATYAGRDAGLVGDALRRILPNRRALVGSRTRPAIDAAVEPQPHAAGRAAQP